MIMNAIGWLLFGLVVGLIARFLMPGRDPMGWIATIALGIVGSIVGGFAGHLLFGAADPSAAAGPAGYIGSILGAMLLLFIGRQMSPNRVTDRGF